MSSSYFERLILQARQFDNGTTTLSETWKLPHVLVGRFAECTEETDACIEALWKTVRTAQDDIKEVLSQTRNGESDHLIGIQQLLDEVGQCYDEMKCCCSEFETAFAEYGYEYTGDDNAYEVSKSDSNNADKALSSANNSADLENFNTMKMRDMEVEFTPDLGWKHKVRVTESSMSPKNGNDKQNVSSTPATASLSNALNKQATITDSVRTALFTPVRERPQEPIYSRHFYNIQNKYTQDMTE